MIRRYFRAALWAVTCCVLCANAPSALAGSNPFVGEVETFAFNFCPVGWTTLNGQLMPISRNTALFSLLGTIYDGDGLTTFALPTAKPIFRAARFCANASLYKASFPRKIEYFTRCRCRQWVGVDLQPHLGRGL
jgi:hypothetical protein